MTIPINVIYEDNHLLVINKDAGMVTQGALPHQTSLLDAAKDYIRVKYQKPGNVYLGVVSRLDMLVSGVIVFARTSKAASRLSQLFREKSATKTYTAVVQNQPTESSGTMVDWLLKDDAHQRMRSVEPNTQGAREAKLRFNVLATSNDLALVEIQLLTGRKHQIRVQLASRGCPIVGDQKYGSNKKLQRGIALHSYQLALKHPTRDEILTFNCPIPEYWPAFVRSHFE